ncbi:hypothetical protein H5410_057125 [Solanum commersonii]|uniref:Uncharacterized protein n=1 Tax=Solanum commersonii TaxID=4109 RepID=A0A9J5WP79_SOLCO|nr:hypothetical protein H5410_057125 [Solanum commersonii]
MELPENGLEHWKAKFIDGLPLLFAERVRKTLRTRQGTIAYSTFSYGKLIGACTQEDINLCNELKLSRQLKIDKLRERSQMGDFRTQFGLLDSGRNDLGEGLEKSEELTENPIDLQRIDLDKNSPKSSAINGITLFQTFYLENTFKMSDISTSEINEVPISLFFTKKSLITILKVLPLNRHMKELICWKIIDGMVTKVRGKGNNPRGRGSYFPSSSKSSYGSSPKSPVIQKGGMSLFNLNSKAQEATSSLLQKQSDTFASIAKDDNDNIKSYEKVKKREVIFLLENSKIQRKEEPWKIFQQYLLNGLYFPGESHKTQSYYETLLISTGVEFQHFSGYNTSEYVYNFSKMIIKQIIPIEDWGIFSMKERQISLNKASANFIYWDYVQAFNKVLYYNNERHKHTWFIKVCAKIFANPIPNWFLNWWSYHGSTTKILPDPFLKLYKEWVKVSPDLNNLFHQEHICYMQQIEQIYFFIEFSIPSIHKWALELDFTKEQIPCLYRTYYNNFWDKLMKKDPKTKSLYRQELLDLIS